MRAKKRIFQCLVIALVLIVSVFVVSPITEVLAIDDGIFVDYSDIETLNQSGRLGFLRAKIAQSEQSVAGQTEQKNEVVFKLFGFIPVKKVQVVMTDDEEYYVGGLPIGLNLNSSGAIVVSGENILKEGDIILKINGIELDGVSDIESMLELNPENSEVEFLRKGKTLKTIVKATPDETGELKLGLWVKDDISGVGTLTFVKKDGTFGALGHAIVENESVVPVSYGEVCQCNLIGIEKGEKNNPGQLRCVLSKNSSEGTIDENTKFGIRGTLKSSSNFVDENRTAKLGGRLGIKMGSAKIVSSVSGMTEEYDIEIIKTNYQKTADDKSLVFRVTDKRLLSLTGGIVQGMSGSPIMQDGKIVGAVTHVFLNDPTKGYGVYVDWMV